MRIFWPAIALISGALVALPQEPVSRVHPAIDYTAEETRDRVAALNRMLQAGSVQLQIDTRENFVRSLLAALGIPVESQVLVFSKTGMQRARISPATPVAVYFNDTIAVGSVPGSGIFEVASLDPERGVIFYTMRPVQGPVQQFTRDDSCLNCHQSGALLRVPGIGVGSVETEADGMPRMDVTEFASDHRTPFERRWGGWYVSGKLGSIRHMGRALPAGGAFNPALHPTPHSDVAALLVLEHQTRMTNLLTRFGWESRIAVHDRTTMPSPNDLVDYMLFVDETPLPEPIQGVSGFAEKFSARGPHDSKGRSLRELDLQRRLMRFPCSYMIYTEAFDSLPTVAKDSVYRRLWTILSGEEKDKKYERLSNEDRQAILEILRDTKKGLPEYFGRS